MEPKPSSAGNYSSNGLAEAAVGNAKLLIRKCLEDKVNFAERLCYFNMCPREDGYSPSKIMHGRRIRSLLPTLDDKIDIAAAKAAREKTDLIIKNKKQTSKPSPPLSLGDLCYQILFEGKRETLVDNPCKVIQIRKHSESYYIRDILTNRIYLRNRKFIKMSESSKNEFYRIKNMEVTAKKSLKHKLVDGKLSTEEVTPPASCMRKKDLETLSKRVQFDSTLFLAWGELRKYRVLLAQSN